MTSSWRRSPQRARKAGASARRPPTSTIFCGNSVRKLIAEGRLPAVRYFAGGDLRIRPALLSGGTMASSGGPEWTLSLPSRS